MADRYDLLLKNGIIVDPVNNREGIADIGVAGEKIAAVAPELSPVSAREVIDVSNCFVLPGIIDTHTHISAWIGGRYGHKMMAQVGVTTALDMAGPVDSVLEVARDYGVGLNVACLEYVRPGYTVRDADPSESELADLIASAMRRGAIGIKILGGHYPLTPDATARAIEVANRMRAYVAFHVGTAKSGSNIEGFHEAVRLAEGRSLHIAHVNSYCRGLIRPWMEETEEAVAALEANPSIRSESYLSPFNGTSAKCSQGVPESLQTQKCLVAGGFPPTEAGLEEAILGGWAQINVEAGGKMILSTGAAAAEYWRSLGTDTTVSFLVNPPEPRLRLVSARRKDGKFAVDCISTDGGGIPRNVIVEMGLAMVKLKALSMKDFVIKTSVNPARLLGLNGKGHLAPGADADITVVDLAAQSAEMAIVAGQVIMYKGYVCGSGSRVITTHAGEAHVKEMGLKPLTVDLENSGFYQGL